MKTEIVFWVDDERNPYSKEWNPVAVDRKYIHGDQRIVWIKDYEEFVSFLDINVSRLDNLWFPTLVCFDHDLGGEKTGLDCAKYLVNFCMEHNLELPHYTCHSSNPTGRENILSYLDSYAKSLE